MVKDILMAIAKQGLNPFLIRSGIQMDNHEHYDYLSSLNPFLIRSGIQIAIYKSCGCGYWS